jgi:hypothetical protein
VRSTAKSYDSTSSSELRSTSRPRGMSGTSPACHARQPGQCWHSLSQIPDPCLCRATAARSTAARNTHYCAAWTRASRSRSLRIGGSRAAVAPDEVTFRDRPDRMQPVPLTADRPSQFAAGALDHEFRVGKDRSHERRSVDKERGR